MKKANENEHKTKCDRCLLARYCITQKKAGDSCQDMVNHYNAGLLLPPEIVAKSVM